MNRLSASVSVLAALFFATLGLSSAAAATIGWTASTVAGPTDVSTAGTLVGAMNVGSATPQTVNGVTFAADPTGAGTLALGSGTVAFGNLASTFNNFWTAANPGGDATYAAALDTARWGTTSPGTVTLGGLTVGRTYLVQLWIADTRAGGKTRIRTVDGIDTTSGGPNIATGTFIADATTQVITVDDGAETFGPQVNLLQLREVLHVTTTADSGAGSLRQALADAATFSGADTITFAAALSGQTITLGSEIVVNGTGGVTVDATALTGGLTVNGGAGGNRIFSISSGPVTLAGLNLTGGDGGGATSPGFGGAILNQGTLTLTRCTLSGNSTGAGGNGGSFGGAGRAGGAIYSGGTLSLTQCTLSGNSTGSGGRGTATGGAGGAGGAIYSGGTLSLTQCTLSGNSTGSGGGGDYIGGTGGAGGAIYSGGTLLLTQCTLSGNSTGAGGNGGSFGGAGGAGGAIYSDGTLSLTQCTLSGNSTGTRGGGAVAGAGSRGTGGAIYHFGATLALVNSIIAGNTASTGPDIHLASGTLTRSGVNLVGDNGTVTAQFPVGSPNINGDFVNVTASLEALASNGGPTQTRRLPSGSLALNRIGNEAQSVTLGGGTSGQFSLSFQGASTPPLAYNTSAADLQTALNTLATINAGGGSVSVSRSGDVFRIVFDGGPLSGVNHPPLLATVSGGGSAVVRAGGRVRLAILPTIATVATLAEGGLPFATDQRGFPIVGLADIGAYEAGGLGLAALAPFSLAEDTSASFAVTLVNPDGIAFTGSGTADNATLLPPGSITLTGSDTSRTVTLTPAADQSGTATVTLTFTDGTTTAVGSFLVTVTPVNDAPTDLALSATSVHENQPVDTVVGTLSGTDPDAGQSDTLTFSLVSGAGDTDNARFNVSGNQLRTSAVFDFEATSSCSIRLRATDTDGLTCEEIVIITVTDVNEVPLAGADSLSRPATARVVKVLKSTLLANDTDADLDPLTITAVGNPLPAGATVALVGNFVVYTAPSATAGSGSFTYTVSDGPGGHTVTGTVTVTEENPAATAGPNALQIMAAGADFTVTFLGVPGRAYRVQYTTDTAPPYAWLEFSPEALHTAAPNGVFTHTDVNPPDPVRLYRAVAQ